MAKKEKKQNTDDKPDFLRIGDLEIASHSGLSACKKLGLELIKNQQVSDYLRGYKAEQKFGIYPKGEIDYID